IASGKTLGYQLPVLTMLAEDPTASALYLSPTKALGADQLRSFTELLNGATNMAEDATQRRLLQASYPSQYDGDTPAEDRSWIRDHSRFILTNPDMLHLSILGKHGRWLRLLRTLKYLIIDECHAYRGAFGSNVAIEMRRLLRIARHYGSTPTVILASATTSHPAEAASRLIGMPVTAITEDGSPQGERTIALWEPPVIPGLEGENGAQVRRAATKEAANIMADLVAEGARTLAFVRSRRGAENTALATQHALISQGERGELPHDRATALAEQIGAYRAGYLAEDRRRLERELNDGTLLGAATTTALELGVDIAGLDAVVIAGFPGTVASFWQQSGRAGRRNQGSLVVLIARSDPLDSYLIHHPETLLDKPVEATVTNPANPNLLVPQLWCATAEIPLDDREVAAWSARDGVDVEALLYEMQDHGMVRHRTVSETRRTGGAWYPAGRYDSSWQQVSLRGGAADEFSIVCMDDGQLLGTADAPRAFAQLHPGAIYLHQGDNYLVTDLDLENGIACVTATVPPWTTYSRADTDVHVERILEERRFGSGATAATVGIADVTVVRQVKEYERKATTGEIIDVVELEVPPTELYTQAVYYHVNPHFFAHFGIDDVDVPGTLHAAEHAAIGMLPLLAGCDRADIGGLSTPLHDDTGESTVFVYDGYQGGAGYALRGYREFTTWLGATRDAIAACSCEEGCPSCIQSPKCGNGNRPLSKAGAVQLLDALGRVVAEDDGYLPPSRSHGLPPF
ncbi:DEAD/DEAH box helicase, partial [Lawsonella clevelandensis]|uniref:DEAD/DEAH box helicase n=1 Tax=Lawsonella clevelandensis TaxID=1528099 RepID=UPI0023F48B24